VRGTVIAVSRNTNTFGYRSVVVLNRQGNGMEGLKQAYGTDRMPQVGEGLDTKSLYCPRPLTKTAVATAKKLIQEAKSILKSRSVEADSAHVGKKDSSAEDGPGDTA
jgi:hypothetical protein